MEKLVDADIVNLLDIPSGSEDGFESGDEDELMGLSDKYEYLLDEKEMSTFQDLLTQTFSTESILDQDVQFPTTLSEVGNDPVNYDTHVLPSTSYNPPIVPVILPTLQHIPSKKQTRQTKQTMTNISPVPSLHPPIEVKNVKWTKDNFPNVNMDFTGNSNLPNDLIKLETPFQIFKYFFTSDLMDHICCETYKYGLQSNCSNPHKMTVEDLQKYMGVLILMSLVNISNVRNYWAPILGNETIKNTMIVNTFEKIRAHLHFNDNLQMTTGPKRDKVH